MLLSSTLFPTRDASMKHYEQSTYEQRSQIEVLNRSAFTLQIMGTSLPTISRALRHNNGKTNRRQIKHRVSIDDRPTAVETNGRIGDWEIDTVIG